MFLIHTYLIYFITTSFQMLALPDVVFENISSIEIGVKKLSLVETPPPLPNTHFSSSKAAV